MGNSEREICGSTQREKYWKELTAEQKIERMRSVIHSMTRENQDTREVVYNLSNNFREHKHIDGKICITLGVINQESAKLGSIRLNENPDEVYF